MKHFLIISFVAIFACSCNLSDTVPDWEISVLPPSVRLDPVTNEIIDQKFDAVSQEYSGGQNLLEKNWIFDGEQVTLQAPEVNTSRFSS